MNLTKLRELNKIRSNIVQNCCKKFSYKYELSSPGQGQADDGNAPAAQAEPVRYSIAQARATPLADQARGDCMRANARAAIEQQHLQPAMLPEFYAKQMERNALVNPNREPSEEDRIATQQRRFQVSKTYANAILPLKMVKLANPFPDPVKMMSSRTVSDQEKSEQMLVEARSQRQYNEMQQRQHMQNMMQNRSFSTSAALWFAKKGKKECPKIGKAAKICPKMKMDGCLPPARTTCEKVPKNIDCKKQESPYPAYSEFCHEDLDEKPSECKLCPWKPEENPNFKPPKKHFHTASRLAQRRGLQRDDDEAEAEAEQEPQQERAVEMLANSATKEGMLCDLSKKPCERPDNRRCPPKKKLIEKKPKPKPKPPKKKCASDATLAGIDDELMDLRLASDETMILKQKDDWCEKPDTCKVKKFPFPPCPCPKTETTERGLQCPKKKRKQLVKDCPPKTCSGEVSIEKNAILMKKKDSPKCPEVDMTKIPMVTPCNPRKKENTKTCPGDLLKKPRKKPPKKQASAEPTAATQELSPPPAAM